MPASGQATRHTAATKHQILNRHGAHSKAMGGKGYKAKGRKQNWSNWEEEGTTWSSGPHQPRAVNFQEAYHVAALRAYPGENGEVLVKRQGAKKDLDMLSLSGIPERLSCSNCEALQRPHKWISMLSATVRQAFRVLPYASEDPQRTGIPQVLQAMDDQLLTAATLLDSTQKQRTDMEEAEAALTTMITHMANTDMVPHLQRMALYGASLYLYAMQMLQATRAPFFVPILQLSFHLQTIYSGHPRHLHHYHQHQYLGHHHHHHDHPDEFTSAS